MASWKCDCSGPNAVPITSSPPLKELLPLEYEYNICSFEAEDDGFISRFRININTKEGIIKWLDEFMISSSTSFRKEKTFAENTAGNLYKVALHCHNNTRPKAAAKKCHEKHTGCRARMVVTVKKTPLTHKYQSTDIHLKELPTRVILYHTHNHLLNSAAALRFKEPTADVKATFLKMFQAGYIPAKAFHVYNADLQELHGEEYFKVAADGAITPDIQWVYYNYYQVFRKEYGEASGEGMMKSLSDFLKLQDSNCIKLQRYPDGNFSIVIMTQLMQRVVKHIPQAAELLFTDSCGNIDRHGCRAFLLMTNSCCGGLPVGVFITTSEKEDILTDCLSCFKLFLDKDSFGGRGVLGPKIIMSDDSKAERNSFRKAFPDAAMMLCIFHVLQACWRYICNAQSDVPHCMRQHIFLSIKKMVYSEDVEAFEKSYNTLMADETLKQTPKIVKYIENLYSRREEWAVFLRKDLLLRGQHTNNICEAAVRVLKENVLNRTKAYSVVQLVDFFLSDFVNFYSRKLIAVASGRPPTYLKKKSAISEKETQCLTAEQINEQHFTVCNAKTKGVYSVDMSVGLCSCVFGQNGRFCKHQQFISQKFHIDTIETSLLLDPEAKKNLLYVASGHKNVSEDWFSPFAPGASKSPKDIFARKSNNLEHAIACSSTQNVDSECVQQEEEYECNVLQKLNDVFADISTKVKGNGTLLSAAEKFIKKYENIHTENKLECALSTFGMFSGFLKKGCRRKFATASTIGVQPTALARRRVRCAGRFSLQSGRPPKSSFAPEHGYSHQPTKSTLLPTKKRKVCAPHNLSYCTENMSH